MSKNKAEIMGINRLRMGTDGDGISTLVTFMVAILVADIA